jgi:CDP-alcohol phosphatidyltransferase
MIIVRTPERLQADRSQIRAAYRSGGGVATDGLHARIGLVCADLALRLRLHPRAVTLLGGICATSGSALSIAGITSDSVLLRIVGVALWHIAYAFDCADGQVARLTGLASPVGARLDLMMDFVAHGMVLMVILFELSGAVAGIAFSAVWFAGLLVAATSPPTPQPGRVSGSKSGRARWVCRQFADYGTQLILLSIGVIFESAGIPIVWFLFGTNLLVFVYHFGSTLR